MKMDHMHLSFELPETQIRCRNSNIQSFASVERFVRPRKRVYVGCHIFRNSTMDDSIGGS